MRQLIPYLYLSPVLLVLTALPAQAKCNGWHAKWCQTRYWNEAHALNESEIPRLRNRLHALPAEIQSRKNLSARLTNEALSVSKEAQERSTRARLMRDEAAFYHDTVIPVLEETSAVIRDYSPKVVEQLPRILKLLRTYMAQKNNIIADRLVEICAQLRKPGLTSGQMEALLYEQKNLVRLMDFSKRFKNPADYEKEIQRILSGALQVRSHLPLETQLLLRQANAAQAQAQSAQQILASLLERTERLVAACQKKVSEHQSAAQTLQKDVEKKLSDAKNTERQAMTELKESQSLEAELRSLPATLSNREARAANANLYWHCCDNEPFCGHLPDADQNSAAYARFEASIARDQHEKRCKDGNDL